MRSFSAQTQLFIRVTSVCTLSLVGMRYGQKLFQEHFEIHGGKGEGAKIAELTFKEESVQRKMANHYRWNITEVGESFYHREALATGPKSKARLLLRDSSSAEIGQNSLVVFDGESDVSLRVIVGSVSLDNGHVQRLVTVGSDFRESIVVPIFKLFAPKEESEFFVSSPARREVSFNWTQNAPSNGFKAGTLEIAPETDPLFYAPLKIAGETKGEGNFTAHTQLPSGTYLWRVRGTDLETTPIAHLTITAPETITLKQKDATTVEWRLTEWYRKRKKNTRTLGTHQLVWARDSEFKEVIGKKEIEPFDEVAEIERDSAHSTFIRIESRFEDIALIGNSLMIEPDSQLLANSKSGQGKNSEKTDFNSTNTKSADPQNQTPLQADGIKSKQIADKGDTLRNPSSLATDSPSGLSNPPLSDSVNQINSDPSRISLSWSQRGANLLLSWTPVPTRAEITNWELWKVTEEGALTSKIMDISSSQNSVLVPLSQMKSGEFFMIQARLTNGGVEQLSSIARYSDANPLPPKDVEIHTDLKWYVGDTNDVLKNHPDSMVIKWTPQDSSERTMISWYLGNRFQQTFIVPGSERIIKLYPFFGKGENRVRVELYSESGSGSATKQSSIVSATTLLGDANGDHVVDQKDCDLLVKLAGTLVSQVYDTSGLYIVTPTWNLSTLAAVSGARIDDADITNLNRFYPPGNCPLQNK